MPFDQQSDPLLKSRAAGSSFVTIIGMNLAKLWIVAPAVLSLPIMWLFGEGDYIVPIMGLGWILCFMKGQRIRKNAPINSIGRSRGFWISVWSFALAALMLMLTVAILLDGVWRWKPPTHGLW